MFVIEQKIDVRADNAPLRYGQPLYSGDDGAHTWRVRLVDNGIDVPLTGATAACAFTRPANAAEREAHPEIELVTVMVSAVVDECEAAATLTAPCYAGIGLCSAVMVITLGGVVAGVAEMTAMLRARGSDAVYDEDLTPLLPSLAQIQAAAAAAQTAANRANTAAARAEALAIDASGLASNALMLGGHAAEEYMLRKSIVQSTYTAGGPGDADALTDSFAAVRISASENASLYAALGSRGSMAYVTNYNYATLSAIGNRYQVACAHAQTSSYLPRMAYRVYNAGWSAWRTMVCADELEAAYTEGVNEG